MAKKFLDYTGLTTVWNKITTLFARKTEVSAVQTNLTNFMNTKSKANGLCPLDEKTQVPASFLPSYVDDVIEGYLYDGRFYREENHITVINGEGSKIYVDLSDMNTYRWSGTAFVLISKSITIGGQPGQAFDGALGAQLTADVNRLETGMTSLENIVNGKAEASALTSHTNNKSNPHGVTASQVGLGNVDNTSDANKPISTATQTALNNKVDKTGTNIDIRYTEGFDIDANSLNLKVTNGGALYMTDDQTSLGSSQSDSTNYSILIKAKGHPLGEGIFAVRPIPSGDFDVTAYEILDESMALSTTDINAICV